MIMQSKPEPDGNPRPQPVFRSSPEVPGQEPGTHRPEPDRPSPAARRLPAEPEPVNVPVQAAPDRAQRSDDAGNRSQRGWTRSWRGVVLFAGGAAIGGAGAIGSIAVLSHYPAEVTSVGAMSTLYIALFSTYRAHADKKKGHDSSD